VALTVTITVCEAQQTGLSPSDAALFGGQHATFSRSVRPEQKTTPVLAPFRAVNEALSSRKQPIETGRSFVTGISKLPLILPDNPFDLLSYQSKAGESTRGPPRMDPPLSC
jgi:hypothetical protein